MVCGRRLVAPLLAAYVAFTHASFVAIAQRGRGGAVTASAVGLTDAGARPLKQSELRVLDAQRYVVVPHWLSDEQTDRLQLDAIAVDASDSAFDCCVGSASGGARLDHSVRRSRQCPFYPPPSNAAGCVAARSSFIDDVKRLRVQLQASATMALPYLEPFETELNYLLYPVGGHYKRHLDIPRQQDAGWKLQGRTASEGGSFCGGRTRRVISFILYLNRDWDHAHGGKLRVYAAHDHANGGLATAPAAHVEDVVPEGGTLVLLMSGDVEHMVRETRAERQCIVGWFNEYRQERVADQDTFGTRTRDKQ